MIDIEKFWKQVSPSMAPKHRGGKVTTRKFPIPRPKPIIMNKPGHYWCEQGNVAFIVYPDMSVDAIFLSGMFSDAFYGPNDFNGYTRKSEFDHYLGPL